jgi:hypothetical protein
MSFRIQPGDRQSVNPEIGNSAGQDHWTASVLNEAYGPRLAAAPDKDITQAADLMSPAQAANYANAMMKALGLDPSMYSPEKLAEIHANALARMNGQKTGN